MAAPRQSLVPAQRTTQSAVMTPALQQAIRMLQLSNLELADAVADALESNPLLREAAVEEPAPTAADLSRILERPRPDGAVRLGQGGAAAVGHGLWQGRAWRGRGQVGGPESGLDSAAAIADRPTLRQHASAEAAVLFAGAAERSIAERLIGELDAWGWCTADPAEIAAEMGVAPDQVRAVLDGLRGMEPAGLFATSLADCLALQLDDRGLMTPALQRLLDHLNLLGDGDLPGLARACGVRETDLDGLVAQLRELNPHPGAAFAEEQVETRVPDLLLRPAAGGGWTLELNPETFAPRDGRSRLRGGTQGRAAVLRRAALHPRAGAGGILAGAGNRAAFGDATDRCRRGPAPAGSLLDRSVRAPPSPGDGRCGRNAGHARQHHQPRCRGQACGDPAWVAGAARMLCRCVGDT